MFNIIDSPHNKDFWNEIDHRLELELDVLDDFASEAEEVVAANPFITYGLPLHRMREFGLALYRYT